MKKLLIASLFIAVCSALAPAANARDLVFLGYDRGGRPVYREVYRPDYGYAAPRPAYGYYEERQPAYCREAPPVRYREDYCPPKEHRFRSPLTFIFGF